MKQFLIIIILFSGLQAFSQGCGDAGACSIDAMKNSLTDSSSFSQNSLKFGNNFGLAQYKVLIAAPYLEYRRMIGKKLSLSAKVSSSIQRGSLTTSYDFSDLFLVSSYYFTPSVKVIAGFKIPFNNANKKHNGLSLPMSYQSTLGTYDLIVGLAYTRKHLSYSLAYQKVLVQNGNEFILDDYSLLEIDSNYISTNSYERKSDILLRISYQQFAEFRKHNFVYSLLPIYHLGQDTYQAKSGEHFSIKDSEGLTLNLNIFYYYSFSSKKRLELSLGAPIIARHSRPDGLTSLAVGLAYHYLF